MVAAHDVHLAADRVADDARQDWSLPPAGAIPMSSVSPFTSPSFAMNGMCRPCEHVAGLLARVGRVEDGDDVPRSVAERPVAVFASLGVDLPSVRITIRGMG
jgi:hypothetical protein